MMKLFSWTAVGLAVCLSLPVCSAAKKSKEEQKAERDAKNRDKEVKKAVRDASRYDKLKEFSVNLYENDLDFREDVDAHYEDVLREHSHVAFSTNISRGSSIVPIHEDRFRQHISLYDNLMVQDYVNQLGQRLVPKDSDRLFAFKLTPSPVPSARTLATGTIYVSTGLVAMLDSEAQLAYVLAHEMAHVYKDHWKVKSIMLLGQPKYNEKQAVKVALWSGIFAGIGAGLGGAIGRSGQAAGIGAMAGLGAGAIAGMLANPTMHVNWDKVQEDEADKLAFKVILDVNYDVREVPKLYATMQGAGLRDSRVTLGFMGDRKRVRERIENCKDLIEKAYSAEIEAKKKQGVLVGDNPEFRHLMAELKRDNGILAYLYDMFDVAKNNLAEAVSIRSNDPAAHYYYGKVLKLVGRTPEERKLADQSFVLAAKYDTRGQNFGAHLHHALALMQDKSEANRKVILDELQAYVNTYLTFSINNARGARLLPPNLDTIYEYMSVVGEDKWMPTLPDDAPMFLEANQVKMEPSGPMSPLAAPEQQAGPEASPAKPATPARGVRGLVPRLPGKK
jgi:predicted Zn-dependent protease